MARDSLPFPVRALGIGLLLATLGGAGRAEAQATPTFRNPPTLPPTTGWSQVAEVPPGMRLIFIAGQVPMDSEGRLVGVGNFRAQVEQVFLNLDRALRASGATFKDVVKLNYYVLDASQLLTVREVRDRYVNPATPPVSTLVQVQRLAFEGILLEVEAMAAVPVRPGP